MENPIQNLDTIDIVGKRKDGSIDLIIVVSGVLNGTKENCELLEKKVAVYLQEISSLQFREQLRVTDSTLINILVVSDFEVDALVVQQLEKLQPLAEAKGAKLKITNSEVFGPNSVL